MGEKNLSLILRRNLEAAGFEVAKEEVFHRDYLNESVEMERPDLIILHDRHLPSQYDDPEANEEELLQIIEYWRRLYDRKLRVCLMCERDRRDPFLASLVARNVLDIFNERQITTAHLIDQLKKEALYANVSKYGVAESSIDSLMEEEEEKAAEIQQKNELDLKNKEQSKLSSFKISKLPKAPPIKAPKFQIHVHKHLQEQKEIALQERKIILVVSPFERTGSTFIAHQLAYAIAKEGVGVRYFENPLKSPYTFDRFAGHLEVPTYHSTYSDPQEVYEGESYVREWIKEGVSIQAQNPAKEQILEDEQFSISRFLRQLLSVHDSPYLIIDIGADNSKPIYDELVEIASHILVVVDNDIPRLEMFEQYQLSEKFGWIHNLLRLEKSEVVVNRYVKGIEESLLTDSFIPIRSFPDEWVFDAQKKGNFNFSNREAQQRQGEALNKVLSLVLDEKAKKARKSRLKKSRKWLPRFEIVKEQDQLEEIK